jgi:hypothetical protein
MILIVVYGTIMGKGKKMKTKPQVSQNESLDYHVIPVDNNPKIIRYAPCLKSQISVSSTSGAIAGSGIQLN